MDGSYNAGVEYQFGQFRLVPATRTLFCDGTAIGLPPRLFDTLLYLVQNAGRAVGRDELLRAVWHGRVVSEANLKQTIFMLRKVLKTPGGGEKTIVTLSGRGYMFTANVQIAPFNGTVLGDMQEPERPADVSGHGSWRPNRVFAVSAMACALALLILSGFRTPARLASSSSMPQHSLAVLPFQSVDRDPAQSYYAEGISDELTNALARVAGLRVAGRLSAYSFRGKNATAGEIGGSLHVGALLEGSVQLVGARTRVTAELVDTVTGLTLWAGSFDRNGGDILQTKADIASAVSAALQVQLLGHDVDRLLAGGTHNAQAFDEYLHGVRLTQEAKSPADVQSALVAFERALAIDPGFALARARYAQALTFLANSSPTADIAAVRARLAAASAQARQAVRDAPDLALAHVALGTAMMSEQDFNGADREMTTAHALAPGDAGVSLAFALTQIQFGRPLEGLRAAEDSVSLDPLAPSTYGYLANAALTAEQFTEARAAASRARILGDGQTEKFVEQTIALHTADYGTALRLCRDGQNWREILCSAIAYHGLGRQAEADSQLQQLRRTLGDNGAFQYAEVYSQWNRPDEAVTWLQTAYRLRDTGLVLMKSDSLLNPIRATPQYAEIERNLNFPMP